MKLISTEGTFECITQQPTAGWIGESEEKQTPFIRIPVVVTDGPEKGNGITWMGYLSNAALDNTVKRLVDAFGFNGNFASLVAGKQTLANLPCQIVTTFEEYNGKRHIRVKWLNPPGGGVQKPMDEARLKSFLDSVNKRAMQLAATANGKTEDDDSSVPF